MSGGREKIVRLLARHLAIVSAGSMVMITACGGGGGTGTTTPPAATTYTLTVNSATPASGVAITASPADNAGKVSGTTSFALTYNSGASVTLTAADTAGGNVFASWTGCATATGKTCSVTMNANSTVTANYATPAYTLTVNSTNPASGVAIAVSPADNSSAADGTTAFTRTYTAGAAVTLTAPATSGSSNFSSWTGCTSAAAATCSVTVNGDTTVTANYTAGPVALVGVSFMGNTITTDQSLDVSVIVAATLHGPQPTGTVDLTSGSYDSGPTAVSALGNALITVPAGALGVGSVTLSATYTPDAASASIYKPATGKSLVLTVLQTSTVSVDLSSSGPAVSDQLLGMNMAAWYDLPSNAAAIKQAFQTAGIKAMRWPGGSWSDEYHWANNSLCSGSPNGNNTFARVVTEVVKPTGVDLALTADYGTDSTCAKGGDPAEAAAWIKEATAQGVHVKYMTVGNEEYGSWETDKHALKNDATTYADATATGYYPAIKAVDASTLVGVDVNPGNTPAWDPIVLSKAKYDFVEYHFYPQGPGKEDDTYLVQQAAQDLTANLNVIQTELTAAGKPNTPIYVGEIGSVYTDPGKQSMSITQALYAGQVLGEMMNSGVVRASWWIGFGGCGDTTGTGNYSSSLYGWQNFGGYMVFSDGLPENGCNSAPNTPAGVLFPTARAFQLFSNVAVTGEFALTTTVTSATKDVRAYAATHSGGVAVVLFNVNATQSQWVTVQLPGRSNSPGVKEITYDKAIYDQSNAATPVWADPSTKISGASTALPLHLALTPWSMTVVLIQ